MTREEIIKHLEYLKIAAEMDAKPESINAEILGAAIQELKSDTIQESISTIEALTPVTPQQKTGRWVDDKCSVCGKGIVLDLDGELLIPASVLDKIRTEIEQTAKDYDKFDDYRRVRGLWIALDIIDKYKESEET